MNGIFEKSGLNALNYSINTLDEKHKQIARNVANADTPMYRSKKLVFDEVMQEYFATMDGSKGRLYATNEKHIQPGGDEPIDPIFFVRKQNNPSLRTDGNDVNLDYEMSELAQSGIMQSAMMELASGKISTLKAVMRRR